MDDNFKSIFLTEKQIKAKVDEAADWLDKRFESKKPLVIGVLKGSVMFLCDLVRAMKTPVQLDFMTISSYGSSTQSSGTPRIISDLSASIEGRDVILVEDIVDSGNTLLYLRDLIKGRGAKTFTSVALLDKPSRREVDVNADYTCFKVGDEFIVGYGLDYNQQYRNLPYIAILKREVYETNKSISHSEPSAVASVGIATAAPIFKKSR